MLWRPNASAGCVDPYGGVLSGLTRHRLYIPVADATLIPEAGTALETLLWATPGAGWCDISVAGQRLPRCLVDVSVWQPERLDFAGPSVLVDGVTRAGVDGVIYGDATAQFNLRLHGRGRVERHPSHEERLRRQPDEGVCRSAVGLGGRFHKSGDGISEGSGSSLISNTARG